MRSNHEKHYQSLVRRRDRLKERLADYEGSNPDPTKRELASLSWVIDLVEHLDREGILEDVAR